VSTAYYNACDYWCERCDHAAECPVYEKTRDKGASDFVSDVKESLDEALTMLQDMAEEFQIDLAEAADGEDEDRTSRLLDADPLVTLSHDFTLKAHKALARITPFVTEDTIKFFEDLQWYHSLVAVKTQRAMSSLYKGLTSADVTRMAIGKCITALAALGKTYPALREECTALARTAEKIRAELDRAIPRGKTDRPD
jgi:hypothetical protein